MNRNPKKPNDTSSGVEEPQPKIMTKPLPTILDELENYIHRVEEAVKLAQSAAKDSRAAADQARDHGEKAADAARKAAETAVAKVKEEAARRADALDDKIAEVSGNLDSLADKVNKLKEEAARRSDVLDDRITEVSENLDSLVDKIKHEVIALDEAFLALKNKHVEQSPFFKSK